MRFFHSVGRGGRLRRLARQYPFATSLQRPAPALLQRLLDAVLRSRGSRLLRASDFGWGVCPGRRRRREIHRQPADGALAREDRRERQPRLAARLLRHEPGVRPNAEPISPPRARRATAATWRSVSPRIPAISQGSSSPSESTAPGSWEGAALRSIPRLP
jgi:hypothetical protein